MVGKGEERQGRYGTSLRLSSFCIILPSLTNLYNTNRCKLRVRLALYAKLYSFAHLLIYSCTCNFNDFLGRSDLSSECQQFLYFMILF